MGEGRCKRARDLHKLLHVRVFLFDVFMRLSLGHEAATSLCDSRFPSSSVKTYLCFNLGCNVLQMLRNRWVGACVRVGACPCLCVVCVRWKCLVLF